MTLSRSWLTVIVPPLLGIAEPAGAAGAPLSVTIQSPREGERVAVGQLVTGAASAGVASVAVVIRQTETADCWVQMIARVNPAQSWATNVVFGDASGSGKRFEVRALANPPPGTRPGRTVCWPTAEAQSAPVNVTRQ